MADQMGPLLTLAGVSRRFGGLRALDDVSLAVSPGEIVGLIGPNGAGKTTLINVVTGVHPASAGRVEFGGQDITRLKPHRIARLGLARTFQVVQPFPHMTVAENVAAGALFAGREASPAQALRTARRHLDFAGLAEFADAAAATLTLARRKRLELAKGLAMRPRLLLLDEVNAGLNPAEIDEALQLIRRIAAQGITIVLVEHLMKVVLAISTRLVVLHHGRLIADGPPERVVRDRAVIEAYLGRKYAEVVAGAGEGAP